VLYFCTCSLSLTLYYISRVRFFSRWSSVVVFSLLISRTYIVQAGLPLGVVIIDGMSAELDLTERKRKRWGKNGKSFDASSRRQAGGTSVLQPTECRRYDLYLLPSLKSFFGLADTDPYHLSSCRLDGRATFVFFLHFKALCVWKIHEILPSVS